MSFTRSVISHIDIAAAPKDVYAVLADLGAYEEWNPFIIRGTGTFAVGERVSLRMSPQDGREMTFKPKVLAAEPGKELRWLGSLGLPRIFDGEHAFVLQATPAGTRLTQSETFRGLLVPAFGKIIGRTQSDFALLNAALRRRAEAI